MGTDTIRARISSGSRLRDKVLFRRKKRMAGSEAIAGMMSGVNHVLVPWKSGGGAGLYLASVAKIGVSRGL